MSIRRGLGLSVLGLASIAFAMSAVPASAKKYTMKLSIIVANDPLHEFIKRYKSSIKKEFCPESRI